MKKINWVQLLIIVLITELIGVQGSLFSGNTGQIYTSLVKPPLSLCSLLAHEGERVAKDYFSILWNKPK